jgi:predicted DCC family thiol-disulfide oxidoreductase YuxK
MDTDRSFDHDILKWALLMVSLTILFTGVAKLGYLPEWASAETQAFFAIRARAREGLILPLSDLLINYRWIALFAGVTTIILEFGLFAAVLTGFSVSPFIIGLIGMHTGIALILTPFFFDQYFIYLLFAPWDSLHKRFTSNNEIDVVYDSRCHFCARSLLLIKNLDDHSAISFHSQNSIPEKYDNDQFDFDEAMYAFSNGEAKKGYFAFRLLFRQFWLLKPLAALMKLRPVKWVGIKLYGWVASNRSRFQCAPDSSV